MYFIYRIRNILNQDSYIGYTTKNPPEGRWMQHKGHANRGKVQTRLYVDMRKLGNEKFAFELLCWGENNDDGAKIAEPLMIEIFNPVYNRTRGGMGALGRRLSEETKEKIRSKKIGVPRSREFCEAMSIRMTGVRRSLESRMKQSVTNTGKRRGPYKRGRLL